MSKRVFAVEAQLADSSKLVADRKSEERSTGSVAGSIPVNGAKALCSFKSPEFAEYADEGLFLCYKRIEFKAKYYQKIK